MPITKYEDDLYLWAVETARAIEERRFDDVDLEHVADEVLSVGKSDLRSVRSQLERIMLHLLKIRYQPGRHTGSWDQSIWNAQKRIRMVADDSPSIKASLREHQLYAWPLARSGAIPQTGLSENTFPEECPFTLSDVLGPLE